MTENGKRGWFAGSFIVWLVLMVIIFAAFDRIRSWSKSSLATPEQQVHWEEWRKEAERQDGVATPVKRRVPKSTRPPALVLLTEHFGVCVGGAMIFTSALFATLALMARGVLSGRQPVIYLKDD